ncbi:MAG: conjugal transfer protein TraS [Ideonella sp.]|nr:conjugal transfer protein TraS [Ideonella sp.]
MSEPSSIDGTLVRWGDRLFYPGNRVVASRTPRLRNPSTEERARALRQRIHATVVRRAPQVMVKVTGGGRGMKAIAAHFRYISKAGRLDIEDDQGEVSRGRGGLQELAEEWRLGGALIEDTSPRREALNVMLSMPRGTDPLAVQRAAREFARTEFGDHKYVMVLHDHQANPHVHLSVRIESKSGLRLNPRKADLHRWRECFAEKLRALGVEAEATRQATRGVARNYDPIWRTKARQDGRPVIERPASKAGSAAHGSRQSAAQSWRHIASVLSGSALTGDRDLAAAINRHVSQVERTLARADHADVDRDARGR